MDFNWLGLASIIIISSMLAAAIYLLVTLKIRNKEIFQLLVQSELDKKSLVDFIDKHKLEEDANDGFVKFLSESRDAAFKYIEDVQAAINSFSKVFDVVATNVELKEDTPINTKELEKATEAYRTLMSQLPKENNV